MRELQRVRAGILIVGMLLLAVAAFGAIGVAPAQASERCASCHFEQAGFEDATLKAPHGQVDCRSCHVSDQTIPRAKFAFYEVFGMRLRIVDPSSSDVTAVKDERCFSCHKDVNERTVEARGLRVKHVECSVGRACIDCHSQVGHGTATKWTRSATMNDCVSCHKRMKASIKCETCHISRREPTTAIRTDFDVTHGPDWQRTHGMGEMSSCSVCHDEKKCGACHGAGVPHGSEFLDKHAELATRKDAKCTACHKKSFCSDCHQTEMPHPASFAAKHSSIVKSEGEQNCVRCHAKKDCDTCHTKHVHPGGAVGNIPAPAKRGERR